MAQETIRMPQSQGGLTTFNEVTTSKFKIQPIFIVIFIVLVIIFIITLHVVGKAWLSA